MTTATTTREETEIRTLVQQWVGALRAKDVDATLDCYAGGVVMFTLAPPLVNAGDRQFGEKNLAGWFATWEGPLSYETRDLEITANEDVAFAHCLVRMRGTQNGKDIDLWFRETLCFTKNYGEWKIAHEHSSVPFYMDGREKAATDLSP